MQSTNTPEGIKYKTLEQIICVEKKNEIEVSGVCAAMCPVSGGGITKIHNF